MGFEPTRYIVPEDLKPSSLDHSDICAEKPTVCQNLCYLILLRRLKTDIICHYLRYSAMSSKGPNLKSYLDKSISLHLNKNRKVNGTLRGYDQFMNLVLGDAVEETSSNSVNKLGMVVIRGNSIVQVNKLAALLISRVSFFYLVIF